MSNKRSREIIIELMDYINNPYLPIIEDACTHLGHPANESDNFQKYVASLLLHGKTIQTTWS